MWWYIDGVSACGRYGLSIITFVGSVFSPYYAWRGRRDPDDHVCMNVALYGPVKNRWAMTERGKQAARRSATRFQVGPSSLEWTQNELHLSFDEVAVPRPPSEWAPTRIKGRVVLKPAALTNRIFSIDTKGDHRWWPIAPLADIGVSFEFGGTDWNGHGYLDCNWGMEPIETAFRDWDWARGVLPDGRALLLYDTRRNDGSEDCLALVYDGEGALSEWPAPSASPLKRGFWGITPKAHHDTGHEPVLVRTLEDSPFYKRSLVRTVIDGEPVELMHETLSGTRFASAIVKAMLPFRMPRRSGPAIGEVNGR
ncbi:carotenoid 1,2-hydratase [Roseibium aquae]|uniref:Carotenoid 1,2-hydratase n=2 Tax=Roseibium aquae TaxID=1323746 RepID=A0A916T6W0_9HYPH|nr:carotenoid 1,2-hydratase [Roseibium aquae]